MRLIYKHFYLVNDRVMAFPETLNIELKTFKTTGIDEWEIVTLKEAKLVSDHEHIVHSMRDFSEGAGGSGEGTIEDMLAWGNWAPINGIPVVGWPVVEIDGEPVMVAKYFGQDKCRFDHWRTFSREVWELVRRYGSYYVKATKDE